jgi:hypothetical protein
MKDDMYSALLLRNAEVRHLERQVAKLKEEVRMHKRWASRWRTSAQVWRTVARIRKGAP